MESSHERIALIDRIQKCGYTIVGVVPNANGYGKPDILLAKRL